jgi:NADH:ubiquinone reductase (H+-translocating)
MFTRKRAATRSIVIAGGGFAGVAAAQALVRARLELRRQGFQLIMIAPERVHTLHFALYELATAELPRRSVAIPLRSLLGPSVGLLTETVESIDPESCTIRLKSHAANQPYNYLLLAPGAVDNYFHIPGLAEHATSLRTLGDATTIRDRLHALAASGGTVLIGGGGFSGVELAAEIGHWQRRSEIGEGLRVYVIEAAPRLIPGLDPLDSHVAAERLRALGIQLYLDSPITAATEDSVTLKDGSRLHADLIIWTGGISPSPIARDSGLPADKAGRLRLDAHLRVPGHPVIFGAGDAARIVGPDGEPLPATAPVAEDSGRQAAENILRDIRGQKLKEVRISHAGYIIPLGGSHALAHRGRLHLRGRLAWSLRQLAVLSYLKRVLPLGKALRRWRRYEDIFKN